jgi:uncharacterized membrane protein
MRISNADLAEYCELQAEKKRIEARLEELKAAIVEHQPTSNAFFSVKITQTQVTRLMGLEDIRDKSPAVVEALEKIGAIKSVAQTRVTVKPV